MRIVSAVLSTLVLVALAVCWWPEPYQDMSVMPTNETICVPCVEHDGPTPPSSPVIPQGWRRTISGWEDSNHWARYPRQRPALPVATRLHPSVVGSLILFLATTALIAYPSPVGGQNRGPTDVRK
ncbi:MAG: hypothetical protein R3E01_08825 [Pirellulaceae bacterium]|nr:hypothetical protein [Planctomycetales bacterium]